MVKNKRYTSRVVVILAILFGLFLISSPQTCVADVVWSDNFDDGDFNDWNVVQGGFSVSNNILVPTDVASRIVHSSSVTSGTWNFDLLWNGYLATVTFISIENNGFYISFYYETYYGPQIEIRKRINTDSQSLILVEDEFLTDLYGSWVSVVITRDWTDEFMVYVNGTSLWAADEDVIDTQFSSSCSYFLIYCSGREFALDNIVVSDTVDFPPPPPIPGFPSTAITLGVTTALGLGITIRRRRTTSK